MTEYARFANPSLALVKLSSYIENRSKNHDTVIPGMAEVAGLMIRLMMSNDVIANIIDGLDEAEMYDALDEVMQLTGEDLDNQAMEVLERFYPEAGNLVARFMAVGMGGLIDVYLSTLGVGDTTLVYDFSRDVELRVRVSE